ncbi:DUF4292 domain-containing protein [Pedobacter sp. MC2016-15]|jgi:hypothetical protein|uniref:DUF4292 domain-containing protein n=1 Tax=Pedobacter sp. MC2016-15 TaxID=2994473 RepID=UPI0022467D04|nr:DUF4292 domain-containing protein [Pedobacter sp. MC2016-15]MCX2481214.1 DUF4292 domain-containing protein [Pedobacter sp. MC2016-15]
MRKNTLNSLLLLSLIFIAAGCKSKKAVVKAPSVAETPAPVLNTKKLENLKTLKSKDLPFNTLSLKGKVSMEIEGKENGVSVNVRVKKDEKIWISLTAIAGIEVARALITPDSLIVRNNLQSVALKKPFSYIYRFAGKQVTFKMLQSVLTGNTIDELMTEQSVVELNGGIFTLTGDKSGLGYRVLFNTLLKTAELNLNDARAGQALKVNYGEYQDVTGALFPSVTRINSVSGTKKTSIAFDFNKIERNVPLDFPFSVPKRFELIN